VTVSELMGNGSHTVEPGEQLIFRAGHASTPGPVVGNCGCPAEVLVERAATEAPKPVTAPTAEPPPPVAALIESSPHSANVTASPPSEQPGSVHVQVEAPFVFRASDPPPTPNAPVDLAEIRLSTLPVPGSMFLQPAPQPEVAQAVIPDTSPPKRKKRHGLWGFLASIFKG